MSAYDVAGLIGYLLAILLGFPAFVKLLAWVVDAARWVARMERVTEQQGGHGVTAARDGAQIGYEHPLAWPVRIVQGFPVALAPDGRCQRWHAAYQEWRPADPALAAEARSRLQLEETRVDETFDPRRFCSACGGADPGCMNVCANVRKMEETQVDESLPVAEPLGPYAVPPVPPDAPRVRYVRWPGDEA